MSFTLSAADFLSVLPESILFAMGMVVLVFEMFGTGRDTRNLAYLSLLSLLVSGFALHRLAGRGITGFGGSITADPFAIVLGMIFLLVVALIVLVSIRYLHDRGVGHGEYYALLLFACGGMMLMVSSTDLLTIFIGLEILSISSYVLCGLIQGDLRSNESALKYFLLGAFATGFLLYGMVLLYGATGSIRLPEIAAAVNRSEVRGNPMIWYGLGLILVGFGFKIALVPFHMWTPDVYEGAPTPVTAFLSSAPKAAGFGALIRILTEGLGALTPEWSQVLWVVAALTMTVGNALALQQDNIKRMLAYSSIAHAGYILVALVAGGRDSLGGVLFYLLAYAFMNSGAFAVLILASSPVRERVTFEDYRGYGYVEPALALAMVVFMLSLTGIPLTAGFAGKFQIFKSAIDKGYVWLAVIGLLNSVVSVYYYLRMIVVMYMQRPTAEHPPERVVPSVPLYVAVAASALGVLYLGVFPAGWLELSVRSVTSLLAGG
ncbi:MAG: NADH-quinone oxidoreductase subunit N [Candidatus Lambdaproteobacteria bacterium]|nr:NADH-quinone oxidoreductase subunit N [Candidatus Lambdaproteobacteria bacterium]